MPISTIAMALAAGLISAVVFVSATTGPMLLRVVLFFLTPLSLYLAGFGLGARAAAIAAIAATLIITLIANAQTGVAYAFSSAVPAATLTRLAFLSRGEGEAQEWYPAGRIIAAAAIFGGLFAALALVLLGGNPEVLAKSMRTLVDAFVKSDLATIPGAPKLTDAQIDDLAKTTLATLPWALGVLATTTILLNVWLAGRITLASERLLRPWPDLTQWSLPTGATYALLFAMLLTFTGGIVGLMASGFAGALLLVFAALGLAVVHVMTRGSPWRNFALASVYAALVVFTAGATLVLAFIGLAETVFGYRNRGSQDPPTTST